MQFKLSVLRLMRALMVAVAASGIAALASAQDAPIRVLVGYAPGGSTDAIARLLAEGMQRELQRTVVVENRAGAGGQIAALALKAAPPDGNTLYLANSNTVSMIPLTMLKPGFDPVKDFAPVGLVAINPDVFAVSTTLVGPGVSSLREYGQWVRANDGQGNVGVPAQASAPDFAVGLIGKALGSKLQSVPYRGDSPIALDLVGGQLSAGIGSVATMLQHARTNKVRIVAVNGTRRLPLLPEVPTYGEQGITGYEEVIFTAMYAPARTPRDVLQRYNTAITRVVTSPAFTEKLASLGIIAAASTPAELSERMARTTQSWSEMVKNAGYVPQ